MAEKDLITHYHLTFTYWNSNTFESQSSNHFIFNLGLYKNYVLNHMNLKFKLFFIANWEESRSYALTTECSIFTWSRKVNSFTKIFFIFTSYTITHKYSHIRVCVNFAWCTFFIYTMSSIKGKTKSPNQISRQWGLMLVKIPQISASSYFFV